MRIVAALLSFALAAQATGASARLPCRAYPDRVGPCRQVHGRITAYNGGSTFRIWVVGTHRLLGVLGRNWQENESGAMLPAGVRHALGNRPFETRVFADFRVCPLTRERAGWMHLSASSRRGGSTSSASPTPQG